jgi:hypothetical protein
MEFQLEAGNVTSGYIEDILFLISAKRRFDYEDPRCGAYLVSRTEES